MLGRVEAAYEAGQTAAAAGLMLEEDVERNAAAAADRGPPRHELRLR